MTDEQLGYVRIVAPETNKEELTELFKERIIGGVGHTGWIVEFAEPTGTMAVWKVNIFANDPENFNRIREIIKAFVTKEYIFSYAYLGNIARWVTSNK